MSVAFHKEEESTSSFREILSAFPNGTQWKFAIFLVKYLPLKKISCFTNPLHQAGIPSGKTISCLNYSFKFLSFCISYIF